MIKIVANCRIKANKIQEFIEATRPLIAASNQEAGCISYDLHQDIQDEQAFAFIECWKDQESIDIHNVSDHFKAASHTLAALTETKPTVTLYKEVQ